MDAKERQELLREHFADVQAAAVARSRDRETLASLCKDLPDADDTRRRLARVRRSLDSANRVSEQWGGSQDEIQIELQHAVQLLGILYQDFGSFFELKERVSDVATRLREDDTQEAA